VGLAKGAQISCGVFAADAAALFEAAAEVGDEAPDEQTGDQRQGYEQSYHLIRHDCYEVRIHIIRHHQAPASWIWISLLPTGVVAGGGASGMTLPVGEGNVVTGDAKHAAIF
jgi:hypothetical protein